MSEECPKSVRRVSETEAIMQQTVRRLACLCHICSSAVRFGVNPASAKSIDQGCETDSGLHGSVRGELDGLCPTEDSPIDSKTVKSETVSTKNAVPRNVEPVPRPIRTITEGQSTTFTAPTPTDRRLVTRCANFADERVRPVAVFRPDGTLVCNYSIRVERRNALALRCPAIRFQRTGRAAVRTQWNSSRLILDWNMREARGVSVTTSTSDNLDDTGTIEVEYFMVGTSTRTFAQTNPGAPVSTSTSECTLLQTARVKVNTARRPGMTAAVSRHAPPQEWIDGTTTSNWTCTQELINYYINELSATAPCTLGDEVTTITENTFATPSGCVVVVTVARNGKGHGSTSCLPRSQAPTGWNSLPDCPDSTDPAVMNALSGDNDDDNNRKQCVARN